MSECCASGRCEVCSPSFAAQMRAFDATPPTLLCGALADRPHGPHEWRWRTTVIPPDLTGETTPYRYCPGLPSVPSSEGEQE